MACPAGPNLGAEVARTPARSRALRAIVVLGCAVHLDVRGRLSPSPLARRVETAAREYAKGGDEHTLVVASGGRRWGDRVEADVMAHELALRGVPVGALVRERISLSTRDNARFAAAFLARRGIAAAAVVTCAFHLPRAEALFSRAGIDVEPVPAALEGESRAAARLWPRAREGLLTWIDLGWRGVWQTSRLR